MPEITVTPVPDTDLTFRVTVAGPNSSTEHEVKVGAADLERLGVASSDAGALVRASFEFLLEREPKESILRSFDQSVIGRYFPEYEREMRKRLQGPRSTVPA